MHDYHSAFLIVERINASRNEISNEGQEIKDLLSKYFIEIFDSTNTRLCSDAGQHRYTVYIKDFCSDHAFDSYFPELVEKESISKITLRAIVGIFKKCDENFIEVQIALGVLRESGSKKHKSPAQILFYEEKDLIVWDSDRYDKDFLEVTYAQLTLMKSKLDHRLLTITNVLLKMNKNSINFKIDYPKLSSQKIVTHESEIESGFLMGLEKVYDMVTENKLEEELELFKASKTDSHRRKTGVPEPMTKVLPELRKVTDDLAEMWGETKSEEMKKRQLCPQCFTKMSANHSVACKGPGMVCFNCSCEGHNSKSCLRKPKWSHKSTKFQSPFPKLKLNRDVFLANQQELLRHGLKHVNFETLSGTEKRLALRSRGYCENCGHPTCTVENVCRAQNSKCSRCDKNGHYSRLCQETEIDIDYMTKADQNLLPDSIMSMLLQNNY